MRATRCRWMLGIAAVAISAALPARAETLSETLAATYRNNPTLQAAREALKATDEQLAQALGYWWRPTVTATLEQGKEWVSSSDDDFYPGGYPSVYEELSGTTDVRQAEITGTLYLWRGGQTEAQIDYARALIEAQEAVLDDTEQTALSQTASTYADVVLQLVSLDLDDEHRDDLMALGTMVEDMLGRQLATVSDVSQVRLALAELEDSRLSTRGDLQSSRSQLLQLSGVYPTEMEHWPALSAPPESLEEALGIAQRENPQIVSARAEVIANEAAVREQEGALLPTLSVVGDWTWNYQKSDYRRSTLLSEDNRSSTASVLLELTIPLYDGGVTYSAVREAKRTAAQSRSELMATEAQIADDVRQAWEQLLAARERIEVGAGRWDDAKAALDGEERLFRQGDTTIRDLIDAHGDVVDARLAIEQAQHDAFVATVNLYTAMGRFDSITLGLDVVRFDPRQYLEEVESLPLGIGLE